MNTDIEIFGHVSVIIRAEQMYAKIGKVVREPVPVYNTGGVSPLITTIDCISVDRIQPMERNAPTNHTEGQVSRQLSFAARTDQPMVNVKKVSQSVLSFDSSLEKLTNQKLAVTH